MTGRERRALPLLAVPVPRGSADTAGGTDGARGAGEAGCSRLSRLFAAAPVALVEVDTEQRVVLWNRAAEALFGWPAAEVVGRSNPLLGNGSTPLPELVDGSRYEARRLHRDGRLLDVEVLLSAVTAPDGTTTGWIAAFTDNRERTALRTGLSTRLRQQSAVAALGRTALVTRSIEPVVTGAISTIVDTLGLAAASVVRRHPDGRLEFTSTHGYTVPPDGPPAPDGRPPLAQSVVGSGVPLVVEDLADPDTEVSDWTREVLLGAGARSSALVPVGGVTDPWGVLAAHAPEPHAFSADDLVFLQAVANVVAEAAARCEAEKEVKHRATHDALTGLPNRALLGERLATALRGGGGRPSSSRPGHTALLLIDLDGFKDVNDSQGHQAGDEVLRQVSDRLLGRLRSTDTVARLGGDEFAVLLPGLPAPEHATWVAAEIGGLLRLPFESAEGPLSLSGSIGIAIAETLSTGPYEMLRRADTAMYRAKRDRSGHAVYDPALDDVTSSRLGMVSDLRAALEDEALTLHYQPVVDLGTGAVTSVEALVRWTHPTLGPQSPAEFVALAESSGLAGDLTDFVLRTAARQWARWAAAGFRIPIGVNFSPMLLRADGYADYVARVVGSSGMPMQELRIEVTESALASESAIGVLRRLRAFGSRVAIDDFGTGWSSLGRLKQLPVDTLKIDRSFVTGLVEDRRDAAIVRSVVALAEELGLRTIAEGVETPEVLAALGSLGVDRAQGYLFSRPVPADELRAWCEARTEGQAR